MVKWLPETFTEPRVTESHPDRGHKHIRSLFNPSRAPLTPTSPVRSPFLFHLFASTLIYVVLCGISSGSSHARAGTLPAAPPPSHQACSFKTLTLWVCTDLFALESGCPLWL